MSKSRMILKTLLRLIPDKFVYILELEWSQKRANHLGRLLKNLGTDCQISPDCIIISPGCVSVGRDCIINEYVHILGAGGVTIGDQVWIANHAAIISVTHPTDVCFIGDYAQVEKLVIIENNVWIGSHAVILPGVRLGQSSVVGAGCVVTHDVPDFAVVAGVPGKVIRYKNLT